MIGLKRLLVSSILLLALNSLGTATSAEVSQLMEDFTILGFPLGDFYCFKVLSDDDGNIVGLIYGNDRGVINVCMADENGDFKEVWELPKLESGIHGLFFDDLDGDSNMEIITHTFAGDIVIFDYSSRTMTFRSQRNMYNYISAMTIHQMDDDPQMELLFIAYTDRHPQTEKQNESAPAKGEPRMYILDGKTYFEQWESIERYTANRILIADVDGDGEEEIILNTGAILDKNFRTLEWSVSSGFGDRMGLMDMDGDRIPEVISQYRDGSLKIFDIDERNEKW